nr:conjugal transfer protein TraI [Flavobacterium supellecticarium]
MRKYIKMLIISLMMATVMVPVQPVQGATAALGIFSLVTSAINKAIKAIDLKIQRAQNKVIWLQNAQKTLENTLTKLKLKEIGEWTDKQKKQYESYYEELTKVKSIISYYQRIRDVVEKQGLMVQEYGRLWNLLRQDANFTADELDYMEDVNSGILGESLQNIDHISLIVQSFTTKMSDAKRLELINEASNQIDKSYNRLRQFNNQNILLSVQRSKSLSEIESVKRYYGIQQ